MVINISLLVLNTNLASVEER